MFEYDAKASMLVGPHGRLTIPPGDDASLKMAMLLLGECSNIGPLHAARSFNYSKSRYYQIRDAFTKRGIAALINHKTGPKRNYRRTPEVTKLVIRTRFLDPDASAAVIASKLRQYRYQIATRSVERIINEYGLQKKLHIPFPAPEPPRIETQRTKMTRRMEPSDARSIERHVRQLLLNKISGNFAGSWLLIAEHLRLGAWDLLRHWSGKDSAHVEPRIGLQLVHEAALCIAGKRQKRTLGQQGFEVANGHMTMALIAQASIHMLRQRLGEPIARWDAKHLARDFFHGLEGDVRVHNNTIIVTYYNAPNADILEKHYTHLPARLAQEGVDPKVPWLYDYKLDFRFK